MIRGISAPGVGGDGPGGGSCVASPVRAPALTSPVTMVRFGGYRWTSFDSQAALEDRYLNSDRRGGAEGNAAPVLGVSVEPAAGLPPQPSRVHHPLEQRAGPVLGIPEALVQDLEDGQADVEADEVG